MSIARSFGIVEDNLAFTIDTVRLGSLEDTLIKVLGTGATYVCYALQDEANPFSSFATDFVEACGTNAQGSYSVGYALQFPHNNNEPFRDIDCQYNIGSYDPNDKTGYPQGFGAMHSIDPGQPLEYRIRFQNTGTDTAFRVVIRDTLSPFLDPTSVVFGATSHPATPSVYGQGIVQWVFDPIQLVDSNANEPESHGFVNFTVQQVDAVPIGTQIENAAAIYFDFNAPVITNTTTHLVDTGFLPPVLVREVIPASAMLELYPNPASRQLFVHAAGTNPQAITIEVYDLTGRRVLRKQCASSSNAYIDVAPLVSGYYVVSVKARGALLGTAKVVVQ